MSVASARLVRRQEPNRVGVPLVSQYCGRICSTVFSAYFGYIFSIVLGAGFIGVGFAFFRYGGYGVPILRIGGTLGMLVGLALILAIVISSPTPWHRTATFAHIFHT